MTARILAGTCSWADKTLVDSGRFYPPDAKSAEDRLRFYAGQFPTERSSLRSVQAPL